MQILSKQKSSVGATISGIVTKLEDMTRGENTFLNKIEVLQEKCQETLVQLKKEKKRRTEV